MINLADENDRLRAERDAMDVWINSDESPEKIVTELRKKLRTP